MATVREKTTAPHAARRRKNDPEDSQAHVHRRETDAEAVLRLHNRIDDHDQTINMLLDSHRDMSDNIKKLTENTGRLADVLEAWANVKGFWWTLKMIGSGVKIAVPVVAVIGAAWLFFKTGRWEVGP